MHADISRPTPDADCLQTADSRHTDSKQTADSRQQKNRHHRLKTQPPKPAGAGFQDSGSQARPPDWAGKEKDRTPRPVACCGCGCEQGTHSGLQLARLLSHPEILGHTEGVAPTLSLPICYLTPFSCVPAPCLRGHQRQQLRLQRPHPPPPASAPRIMPAPAACVHQNHSHHPPSPPPWAKQILRSSVQAGQVIASYRRLQVKYNSRTKYKVLYSSIPVTLLVLVMAFCDCSVE